jgi:hypothetical protein
MDFERYEIDLNAKCVCGCMEGNRLHKIYRFPNGMGASVVSGSKKAGAGGKYRMYVLRFLSDPPENSWEIACDTSLTEDVIECHDWNEVESALVKVTRLLPSEEHGHPHDCMCGVHHDPDE